MKVGGYQIIDLKGVDIGSSPTINGLYDLIEGSQKPILLSGIVKDGTEYHDVFVTPISYGEFYLIRLTDYGFEIGIYDNGTVQEEV